ncbi:MAG: prenyltransferase/squalene oxidase repeat-containing protein [Rhodanobacteraceae bacterium]
MRKHLNQEYSPAVLAHARDATARLAEYLRDHQSRDGGFCFYRWGGIDEPTLHDTWRALAIFALLGLEVPRRGEVMAFLLGFDGGGFDDLYHLALALDLLGVPLDPELRERIGRLDALDAIADKRVAVSGRLRSARRIVLLQRRVAAVNDAEGIVEGVLALQRDEAWGDKLNLGDTWSALAILDACGEHDFDDATRDFVDDLQVASFGFTATRDSLYANLDTVYAGILAAAVLELPLRYGNDALGFVLACQSDNGGFARTPDALPDFAFTHRALMSLVVAGAMPAPGGILNPHPA